MSDATGGRWHHGTILADGAGSAGTVVKFGGSLFGRADWPDLARDLVDGASPAAPRTFVVGGGAIVDGLRQIDAVRRGDDTLLHALAIDGMGITARLVAATLGLPVVDRPLAGTPASDGRPRSAAVLDMAAWIATTLDGAAGLPASWEVTSDSLAARVAAVHGLGLLLAKRTPPPMTGIDAVAAAGWVDPCFPRAVRGVGSVEWVAPAE